MQLAAQAPAIPPTYSFVELNSMVAPNMTIKAYRDGPREIVLQTRPASAGSPKRYNGGLYYDFKEHFMYVWDATDSTPNCGRQQYADTTAPSMFDVVTGTTEMLKEASPEMRTAGVREMVNGMPAMAWNIVDTAHGGSTKIWLADKAGYLLKMVASPKGATPVTVLEIKSFSLAQPAAAVFTVPSSCKSP
jgi:hypothetical protein